MIKVEILNNEIKKENKTYEINKIWDLIKKNDSEEYLFINKQNNINNKVVNIDNEYFDITKKLVEEFNIRFQIISNEEEEINIKSYMKNILSEINYYGFIKGKANKSIESLLTIGNGYQGLKGSLLFKDNDSDTYSASYICGLYNKVPTIIEGKEIFNEDFVNIGNYNKFNIRINDKVITIDENTSQIYRSLNLKTGILEHLIIHKENNLETEIKYVQFVSTSCETLTNFNMFITPLNHDSKIDVTFEIDLDIKNLGVDRYSDLTNKHLELCNVNIDDTFSSVEFKTLESNIDVMISTNTTSTSSYEINISKENNKLLTSVCENAKENNTFKISRTSLVQSSNNMEIKDVKNELLNMDLKKELSNHLKGMKKLWDEVDIQITGDNLSQRLVHINTYHLLVSLSEHNENKDVSITARGLHGEAYRGHIFWDEIFIMPYYIAHYPKVAKSMLLYRFNRLGEAKKNAKNFGYDGAMYPWQSGRLGDEQTQLIHLNPISGKWGDDFSSLQRHVSLAIAYNIINYVNQTNDQGFLKEYGFEMLLEITKFWVSKTSFNSKTKKYSIDKVMGPDEFHEKYPNSDEGGLKDNAYTNFMVSWLITNVLNLINVHNITTINDDVLNKWNDISKNLNIIIKDGIIAQYDGYFELDELDFDYYRQKYGNIYRMDRILKGEGKSVDHFKCAKQADTLMIFYLFNFEQTQEIFKNLGINDINQEMIKNNLNYYLQRTTHGSSLSRIVHSLLAQNVGEDKAGFDMYLEALASDYIDIQGGTTAEGIHTGVMASSLYSIYLNYAGIDFNKSKFNLNPKLPTTWNELNFNILFKGEKYNVHITHEKAEYSKI